MGLEFQNHYHNKIWIALVYGDTALRVEIQKARMVGHRPRSDA